MSPINVYDLMGLKSYYYVYIINMFIISNFKKINAMGTLSIFSTNAGLVHLLASILALITGTLVLLLKKGTDIHKRIGYLYSLSMVVLLITAFMIYNLFGGWGIFHWAAVVSSLTLAAGMIPMILKKPRKQYVSLHLNFMYWSVMGLYGAFFAETMVRLPEVVLEHGAPNSVFYNTVGIVVFIVMAAGGYLFYRNREKWEERFA